MRGERNLLIGAAALVALLAASAGLVSCGFEQSHEYVQSPDGSLSFRHPRQWNQVDLAPVGLDWLVALDGSADPSPERSSDFFQDAPFLLAQVMPLEPEVREQASLASLRVLALQDGRDPTAGDPTIRILFHDEIVDEHGFEGHHLRFEVDLEGGTAIAEHMAVFDPARNRVEHIRVACSLDCFEANAGSIDDVFASVRFRE